MATTHLSRGSLTDVLNAVKSAPLPDRRRQDLASAVRTVGRLLGRSLDEVAADPRALAIKLKDIPFAAHRLSRGRWNNIRSLFRAALTLVRPMMPGRSLAPMSPTWAKLFALLLTRSDRARLSRLLRWLSAEGIEPEALTIAHLERFRVELTTNCLLRNPDGTWADLVWGWNRSAARIAEWPKVTIVRVSRRQTYTRPWSAFPASLKADVDGWLGRLAGRDLSDDGPLRPARPSTLATREYQLRAFASVLVLRGHPPDSVKTLADLVAYDALCDGLKFFYERNGRKSSSGLHGMATMLTSVARHWVGCDEGTIKKIRDLAKRLAVPTTGLTQKNRERLRQFDDDNAARHLVDLPFRIRAEITRHHHTGLRPAVRAQAAVAIAILLAAPIRRRNLASIEIGTHLLTVGRKRHLVFPDDEVKNRIDIEFELPDAVAELIDWYVAEHRPTLMRVPSDFLFPGAAGGQKSSHTLGLQIIGTVFQATGLKVNAHLFRHIGAKLFLDQVPGAYEVVRRVLGHKKMDTTTNHYAGAETKAATRHFDDVVFGLRRDTAAPARRAPRAATLPEQSARRWRGP